MNKFSSQCRRKTCSLGRDVFGMNNIRLNTKTKHGGLLGRSSLLFCFFILYCLAGCSSAANAVKTVKTDLPLKKYNVGISAAFQGDGDTGITTEMAVKELAGYPQIKIVDRRILRSKVAAKAAFLAEGTAENIKFEDPIQYLLTGSVLTLGSKKIIRLSIINIQTSTTDASVTVEYGDIKELKDKIAAAVAELMQSFTVIGK